MQTFEDVVSGARVVQRVWEDEGHIAFLAPSPIRAGHTIVIPRKCASYLFELGPAEHTALWEAVRQVALILRERLPCERVCVAVVGWEVRHVHVHLVPTDRPGEFPPLAGTPMSTDELEWIAGRVRSGRLPSC